MVAVIGGVLFGAGYLIASLSASYAVILIGIGVLAGAGIGFGYVCPLATCVKWFPRQKGLITGVSVAGFGAGAILLSSLAQALLGSHSLLSVFRIIGISYGVVIVASAVVLSVPKTAESRQAVGIPLGTLVGNRVLWGLFAGMFAGTFAGLLVIGNLKPIGLSQGLPGKVATLGISLLAVGNAIGRLTWGWVFDRIGRLSIYISLILMSLCVSILLLVGVGGTGTYYAACTMIGFCFGSCFVLYATSVCEEFGSERMGSIYPWVFLGYGASAITGPPLAGWVFDVTGRYTYAVLLASAICIAGCVAVWALYGLKKKVSEETVFSEGN
jgi:OFA family oxalate/formate antiporter-like MFS transporter